MKGKAALGRPRQDESGHERDHAAQIATIAEERNLSPALLTSEFHSA